VRLAAPGTPTQIIDGEATETAAKSRAVGMARAWTYLRASPSEALGLVFDKESQAAIADRLGVSQALVSYWRKGTKLMNLPTRLLLAELALIREGAAIQHRFDYLEIGGFGEKRSDLGVGIEGSDFGECRMLACDYAADLCRTWGCPVSVHVQGVTEAIEEVLP